MANMLEVPAIKFSAAVTLVVGFKAFDSTFHRAILMDINCEHLPAQSWGAKIPGNA
jgi:hypothetical protein